LWILAKTYRIVFRMGRGQEASGENSSCYFATVGSGNQEFHFVSSPGVRFDRCHTTFALDLGQRGRMAQISIELATGANESFSPMAATKRDCGYESAVDGNRTFRGVEEI